MSASDLSAANRRHDEKHANSPWFRLWRRYGVGCRAESPVVQLPELEVRPQWIILPTNSKSHSSKTADRTAFPYFYYTVGRMHPCGWHPVAQHLQAAANRTVVPRHFDCLNQSRDLLQIWEARYLQTLEDCQYVQRPWMYTPANVQKCHLLSRSLRHCRVHAASDRTMRPAFSRPPSRSWLTQSKSPRSPKS